MTRVFLAVKRSIRSAGLHALRAAGAFQIASHLRRESVAILCYHGLSLRDEHLWEGGLYMPPQLFRQRLLALRALGANVLPLREALTRLTNGTLPRRSVVITFDDGFRDFYRHAYPALREFEFPCTLYLTTYYATHRVPVFNLILNYLLWKGNPTLSQPARVAEVERRGREVQSLDVAARDAVARQFAESVGVSYEKILEDQLFQIMTPEEIAETARGGIDIELHTHRHRTPLNRELFLREIADNTREIENMTGKTPHNFCYPSGAAAPQLLPWLRESGVVSATTCEPGRVRAGTEALLLPRFLDGFQVTPIDFESWVCGLRG